MKNLNYDLKSLGKVKVFKEDDSEFIDTFLNEKIKQQTKITGEIKSTLKSLERSISIPRSQVLLESEKQEEG